MIISLIVLLDNLDFVRDDVRVMTDEDENPQNLPTKDNIVRRPYEVLLQPYIFIQLGAMRALVAGAQTGDSFFLYCK